MLRRLCAFHPILFALFPVLSLAASNTAAVALREVWPAALLCLAAAAVLWCLLRPLLGSWRKAGVATSLVEIAFFSYVPMHAASQAWIPLRHRFALPLLAVLLLAAFWKLRRAHGEPIALAQGLTLASAFLVAASATRLVRNQEQDFGGLGASRALSRGLRRGGARHRQSTRRLLRHPGRLRERGNPARSVWLRQPRISRGPEGDAASTLPTGATATTRRRRSRSPRPRTWST